MPEIRTLTATLQGSLAEYKTLEGEQTLVVPIISMLGDTVVWASNSDAPEFVPRDVLLANPAGMWNNVPVVWDHPRTSAKDPAILNERGMGRVFNARAEGPNLAKDLYLSPSAAKRIGGEVEETFNALVRGEDVEVSIGARVETTEEEGVHNGKEYKRKWTALTEGDHLAILNPRSIGACSNEMGCGRLQNHKSLGRHVTNLALEKARATAGGGASAWRTLTRTKVDLGAVFRELVADFDDGETLMQLWDLLAAEVEGLRTLERVSTLEGQVVYSAGTSTYHVYYMREFKIGKDGAVTLKPGEPVPLELAPSEFRPVEAPVKVPSSLYYFQQPTFEKEKEETMSVPVKPKTCNETASGVESPPAVIATPPVVVSETPAIPEGMALIPQESWQRVVDFIDKQVKKEKAEVVDEILTHQGEGGHFTKCALMEMPMENLQGILALAQPKTPEKEAPKPASRKAVYAAPSPSTDTEKEYKPRQLADPFTRKTATQQPN